MFPRLYAIVDADVSARAGWDPRDLARAYLASGARLLQLRAKQLPSGAFLDLAAQIVDDAATVGARLIVNDRADLAMLSGAAGVHVGQDDLSPADVRLMTGSDMLIGLSTHTPAQIDAALAQPISYLAVGPTFGTMTKDTGYDRVGLDLVRQAVARAGGLPVVAIGGITLENARSVIDSGATSVAVISDLLTGRPEERVKQYLITLG